MALREIHSTLCTTTAVVFQVECNFVNHENTSRSAISQGISSHESTYVQTATPVQVRVDLREGLDTTISELADELIVLPKNASVSEVLRGEDMDAKSLTKLLNQLGRRRAASCCVRVMEWAESAGVLPNVYHYRCDRRRHLCTFPARLPVFSSVCHRDPSLGAHTRNLACPLGR